MSQEEIWSLYLTGEVDKLKLEEISNLLSDLRNLAKSPAWEALRKAAEAVGREENDIPAHSFKDPIQGILGQEFGKGFQAGVKRQIQLVDMWTMELDELRKLKAEENALHDEAM